MVKAAEGIVPLQLYIDEGTNQSRKTIDSPWRMHQGRGNAILLCGVYSN